MKRWWQHVWRTLGTGHCFAFLFVGGFILSLTALPMTRLLGKTPEEKQARARRLLHHAFRFYLWQMQALGLMRLEIQGRERLAQAGGKLVIANHPSLLDVVILISLLPECDCVIKADLRRSLVRGVVAATGYTDNRDGDALLTHCHASLSSGVPVVVFPEGTRSTPHAPLVFQRGAANIAVRCAADILPVIITCDPPTLLKSEPWYRIPAEKPLFRVRVLPPIPARTHNPSAVSESLATRQLNRRLLTLYTTELHLPGSNDHHG